MTIYFFFCISIFNEPKRNGIGTETNRDEPKRTGRNREMSMNRIYSHRSYQRTNHNQYSRKPFFLIVLLIFIFYILFLVCLFLWKYPFNTSQQIINMRTFEVTPADYQKVTYLSEKYKLKSYIWVIDPQGVITYWRNGKIKKIRQ